MKIFLVSALLCAFALFDLTTFSFPESHATTLQEKNTDTPVGDIYQFANGCYAIYFPEQNTYLSKQNDQVIFSQTSLEAASKFTLRPAGLGTYLLYDESGQYLIEKNQQLAFASKLESEMTLALPQKEYLISPAEWELHASENPELFKLNNIKSAVWLSTNKPTEDKAQAANISFKAASGCMPFPESNTNASGKITKTLHDDGSVWGFVDGHEHSGGNNGFGGRVFHGASFHKLGIEHALADCEKYHGENGSRDLMSISYKSGAGNISGNSFMENIYLHLFKDKSDHATQGYPELTNWNVHQAPTHQSLYYKWIERAYLGGMRLMVEYMESTEVVCEAHKTLLPVESDVESCNEMEHVDHQIIKMLELQDYVDAQNGGPGKGWLRIVYSPEEAREVIKNGKLAVILGIEIENPFNCFVDAREGFPSCDADKVKQELNRYYDKGVRAMFPSHKFVNAFSSGDGDAGILEIGDYLNTGQWRDYVACADVPGNFLMNSHSEGKERSLFAKLADVPGMTLLNNLLSGSDAGTPRQTLPIYAKAETHCQRNGFTPLGLELIEEMMALGMIIDMGHTPKAALNDLIPVLVENDYPAVHTHGGDLATIKHINGFASRALGNACRDAEGKSDLVASLKEIAEHLNEETGLPLKGLSYDFNGFASYNKPRFGDLSRCEQKQDGPMDYPFSSFAGDMVFDKLQTGEQVFDFNTHGLANIGLYPDMIEEARRAGASDQDITALFRTAEAYIRIWEKAESKSSHR